MIYTDSRPDTRLWLHWRLPSGVKLEAALCSVAPWYRMAGEPERYHEAREVLATVKRWEQTREQGEQ